MNQLHPDQPSFHRMSPEVQQIAESQYIQKPIPKIQPNP